jgi:hypothetical protein
MLTARLLTNCLITQRNILTPERISQGHVQTGGGLLFRGPFCIKWSLKLSDLRTKIRLKSVEWIHLAQNMDRCSTFVKAVMKFRVP